MSSSYDSKELFNLSSLASKGYPEDANLLLSALFIDFADCYIEIRLLDKGRPPIQLFYPSIATIRWDLIRQKNSEGYNCYFGVCLRKVQKGDKSSVASISAVWADVDAKNFSGGKPEALAQLKKLPPYLFSSVIVDTGHGYHLYWLLREAELIESPQDILRLEAYMKGLALTLHGDSTSDLSRVLRLPGLVNQKDPKNPCLAHIIHWEPERRFAPMDFDDYQAEIRESPKRAEGAKRERSDEFNTLAVEKLLENCLFMQHCRDEADTLFEPRWWSMCQILSFFGEPGKEKAHELSKPYPRYTEAETNQKLEYAQKAADKDVGPHTCGFIEKDLGFTCSGDCLAKKWSLKSPIVLAARLASEGLHITIDGTTYFERLDLNSIISRTKQAREDAPPTIKTLTSFIIEPRMRITLDGESERLDAVLKTAKAECPNLFKREAWNSKRQFLAALPSVDLQYYGTDKDTQAILAMITSKELPIRRGTMVLGRNGDLWVTKDGIFSKDGWLQDPDLIYIPSEVDFDRRVHYPNTEDETGLIRQIVPLLLMLNEGKVIFPVLGWFFSTTFVPEIRRRLRHFPILVVWGTHGGGKSSLLNLLWELFGVKSELFSSTETAFTFLRLFSCTNTIPILIDEFKPFNMKEDETRLLVRFLKRLYDGEIEHRGRPDLSLVAYHLQAPTGIAGEVTPIALESAMVERVIQVNLNPDTLTANPNYVKAFTELANLDLGGFALPYIRWCLATTLDDLMTEARTLLPAAMRDVPPRVRDNALVMVTGLVALKHFAAQYGVEIAQEAFGVGIEDSIKGLVAELFERGPHEEIGLTIFLETLATLAQTGRIKHGVHYTTDDINTRLYIHLPDCLAEFRRFVRDTSSRVEVLDERAYRRQAREVCLRKGYVLNTNCGKWFESSKDEGGRSVGKTRRCIEIDMEQLPFDTSGFEKPVKD